MDGDIILWECTFCSTFSIKATLKRDSKLRPIDTVCSKCNDHVYEFKIRKADLSRFISNQHSKENGS